MPGSRLKLSQDRRRHGPKQKQKATNPAARDAALHPRGGGAGGGRWKQVIGDGLRAHTDERRATGMDVAVHAPNRRLELGHPEHVRVA